jgi:predicted nucleic-acid-binding protein
VIGLDTNVLARYFVEEANANSATEAQLRTMQP